LLLIGALIGIATLVFLIRYRKSPGVKYWLIWQLAASVWAFTYAFEFAATHIDTKILWSKFSYFGIVYCTISYVFFSLEFSSQNKFLKKKYIYSMFAVATLFILSPFTNDFHHLHWVSYSINPETNATNYVYGPFFWIIFAFSYLTLTAGIINLFVLYFRLSSYYKRQIFLLLFASLLPPAGNLIYVFHINPVPGFDWTPFTFLITGVLIAINIAQFKLFDVVPFGRSKLIDVLPDAIVILDNSMRIADYNPAMRKLIQTNDKELNGRQIEKYFPHREYLIKDILANDEFRTELLKEVNGETFVFDFYSTSLFDHNKQRIGSLLVLKDITLRVRADEKVKDANLRLKDEILEKEQLIGDLDAFSHTVAHDLKNMLGAIVSASSLIKSGLGEMPEKDILEINDLINQAATKTIHITKELLTLASVRQQEIRPEPVNMKKIVVDSLKRLNNLIQGKNVKISLPENWPEVLGYEAWIEEVWINYISNAIKYGGTPPEFEIGSSLLADNRVKYWIKDNGKGLAESEMAALFNKFTRLDSLRAEGHGLGLSIVKRIIEKLNGEVGVESENIPGKGSTFYFILALAQKS
jgi:PAS domain S-box-containing protein